MLAGRRRDIYRWTSRLSQVRTVLLALTCLCSAAVSLARADQAASTIGQQTVGLAIGGMIPMRVLNTQSSKLMGLAAHPSWQIALTDPVGRGWLSGSIALGAELAVLGITQPTGAYGIGVTPKLVYTFTSSGRVKPYLEGGGGPLWTNFEGRIPEQGSDFNFLVWGGAGIGWDITSQLVLNAGVRFSHISNGGTYHPNGGMNYLLPFIGFSTRLF